MIGLKIVRSLHSILGLNNSLVLINVSNIPIRSIQSKSYEFTISTYSNDKICSKTIKPVQNVSTMNFVPKSHNKMNILGTRNIGGKYGLFHQENVILTVSGRHDLVNYKNLRKFSNDSPSNASIPTTMQLEGVWKILSESAPVEFSQNALIWVHTSTGLPWWATIIITTWSLRAFVTLPLALYQNYILAKYYNLKHDMDVIVKNLKLETNYAVAQFKWTEDYARAIYTHSMKKQWQKLIERDNCHPMKSAILILVQIPMWVTLSTSLRNLCYILPYPTESARDIYLELTTGGFGWMTNLTVPDSSFIIPITLGLLNLTIIEMQYLMRLQESSRVQKYLRNFFRLIALGMVPLAAYVPASISLYWVSSSAFGIVQNVLLMSPKVRRLARVPITDQEIDEPYRHFYKNLRRRIGLKADFLTETAQKIIEIRKK